MNHCICDVHHLIEGLQKVLGGNAALKDIVQQYEAEMIPRGQEEVKCSVENGLLLHDWEKVQQSPVFKRGFKPMDGHNSAEGERPADAKPVSEHAKVHATKTETAAA